jgi:hypothetical protein
MLEDIIIVDLVKTSAWNVCSTNFGKTISYVPFDSLEMDGLEG